MNLFGGMGEGVEGVEGGGEWREEGREGGMTVIHILIYIENKEDTYSIHFSHIYNEHNFYSSVLFYSDDFRTIW